MTKNYEFDPASFAPFTSISYVVTGGISRRLPVPTPILPRILFGGSLAGREISSALHVIFHDRVDAQMMSVANLGRQVGNQLYKTAFPADRLFYDIFKSYSDRVERKLLQSQLARGSVVVDGGANIGIYSQFLSKCVGPRGTVHSFEPSPDNYRRLQERLINNPNITLNQLVVGDRSGQTLLYLSNDLNVDHRAYSSDDTDRESIVMRSTSLDDYFQPGDRVDLIKLDIQGYEVHDLRGAERVLAGNPQIQLLLEFWPYGFKQAGSSAAELISFLGERGFSISRLTRTGMTAFDGDFIENPLNYYNLFARNAPKEHAFCESDASKQTAARRKPRSM